MLSPSYASVGPPGKLEGHALDWRGQSGQENPESRWQVGELPGGKVKAGHGEVTELPTPVTWQERAGKCFRRESWPVQAAPGGEAGALL